MEWFWLKPYCSLETTGLLRRGLEVVKVALSEINDENCYQSDDGDTLVLPFVGNVNLDSFSSNGFLLRSSLNWR